MDPKVSILKGLHCNLLHHLGQKKNMCGSGYPTYPKFLLPTLNFFSPNTEVGRE